MASASLPGTTRDIFAFPAVPGKEDLHSSYFCQPQHLLCPTASDNKRSSKTGQAMHCLSFPCSMEWKFNAGYMHPEFYTATERLPGCMHHTCTSPAIKTSELENLNSHLPKHHPNKRVLWAQFCLWEVYSQVPTAAFLGILLVRDESLKQRSAGSACKLLFSMKHIQQSLGHPSTPKSQHNYNSPKPCSLQATPARP